MGIGCPIASNVNQALFQRGARYPGDTIWYGDGDPFYPLSHSQKTSLPFRRLVEGAFHAFPPPESNGHRLVAYPDVWASLPRAT